MEQKYSREKKIKAIKKTFLLIIIVFMSFVSVAYADDRNIFYDDFSGLNLDYDKWLTAEKKLGRHGY